MAKRNPTPPPAPGPTCPGCRALADKIARLERQQRKQAAAARKYEVLLPNLREMLAEEKERSQRLEDALSYVRFVHPYLIHQFSQHLPHTNSLAAGLFHLN